MAKRKNQEHKQSFQEFLNTLKRDEQPRIIDQEEERQYILIVTEGEKTEPNYFKGIIKNLPNHLVQVEIIGEGANTKSVVKSAIQIRDRRTQDFGNPDFDEIWVVFDKDDFPAKNFNSAIEMAKNEDIQCAYSNEAFELWYILHFQFLDAAVNRKRYIEILKETLGNYEKNQDDIYQILKEKGNESQAIQWAKRLHKDLNVGNPAEEKPTTLVYQLVESLNRFKRNQ